MSATKLRRIFSHGVAILTSSLIRSMSRFASIRLGCD
jgi:hypothetical protein